MPDLTAELQRIAEDAARQARPLAAAEVLRRGDRRRRWFLLWRSAGGLAAAAVTAAVALAVTGLPPAGHHRPGAQLAAWTVTRHAGGTVYVAVRQFRDPAGLQRTLRADGVPASVGFLPFSPKHTPCRGYPASQFLVNEVVQVLNTSPQLSNGHYAPPHRNFLVIHPAALPPGAGLRLLFGRQFAYPWRPGHRPGSYDFAHGLVYTSPQCTGSPAWAGTKHADGTVYVAVRQFRDPAGLQRTLRADGVPANVGFLPFSPKHTPCRGFPASQRQLNEVVQVLNTSPQLSNGRHARPHRNFLLIHPAALPPGTGLRLLFGRQFGYPQRPGGRGGHDFGYGLVYTSPRCTGG